MSVKIFHNPRCSKSRAALQIIRDKGIEPEIIEYLKTPPVFAELSNLIDQLELESPLNLMRKGESAFKDLNLSASADNKDSLISAMTEHPILIERPIVVSKKGARIGRPPEIINEIL